MDWFDELRSWLSNLFQSRERRVSHGIQGLAGQTQRFNRTLFVLAIFGLAALIVARGPLPGEIKFIVWALVGALASAVVGAALGLLFGLPTVEAKREAIASAHATGIRNGPAVDPLIPSPPATPLDGSGLEPNEGESTVVSRERMVELGYRDSTSLEQIADWLTKIIVGLTLTQYGSWQGRFQVLASDLTDAMMGGPARNSVCARFIDRLNGQGLLRALDLPVCRASPIPGGVIIVLFATTGFLICYLWMRRYFILEMVIARREAEAELKKEFERAKDELRLTRQRTENKLKEAEVAREEQEKARSAAEQEKLINSARDIALAEASPIRQPISNPQLEEILKRAEKRAKPESQARGMIPAIRDAIKRGVTDPDDPWQGHFGQASSVNGVRIEATVSPLVQDPQFFKVELRTVAETAARAAQLQGTKVLYFLHPTFGNQPRVSYFGADGTAPLELFAYGAFTVGALLDDGSRLELNLAAVPGAPARFIAQ